MLSFVKIVLSWLYSLGVSIRHVLYDKYLLPSFSVKVPTICVGNIAVGGTGKTPMTAYLVQLLLDKGYHPAVLSRGYKRKTHGFLLADTLSTTETIGDEAMQLHRTDRRVRESCPRCAPTAAAGGATRRGGAR